MSLKPFLCMDKHCIYCDKSIEKREIPLFASSQYTHFVEELVIYCKKKQCFIHKYITQCNDFQNTTLEQMNHVK